MDTPRSPMDLREEAREVAMTLALKGRNVRQIRKELDKRGMGDRIDAWALEGIVEKTRAEMSFLPPRSGRILPRVVGAVALAMGLGVKVLMGGLDLERGWSRLSILAVVLGLILILKPESGGDRA